MLKRIPFFILGLCGFAFFYHVNRQDDLNTKPEIFIVGTIHSKHFKPEYNYSIIDLQAQISALKPDLVCGEIVPEAFNQRMEGYFPLEAAFLAEMALTLNYRFVPVDWRLDFATQAKADSLYPESLMEQVSSIGNSYFAKMMESDCQSIYDEIHSEVNITIVDSVFEKIIGTNPIAEIAHGNWHERNRRIVENGLTAARNSHRIVFVFGSDHIPQIRRQLNDLGFESQIPKRLFVPNSNFKVPDAVLERWKRNLENLKLICDKKISTSDDNYLKIINTKRVQELEIAIQKLSSKKF